MASNRLKAPTLTSQETMPVLSSYDLAALFIPTTGTSPFHTGAGSNIQTGVHNAANPISLNLAIFQSRLGTDDPRHTNTPPHSSLRSRLSDSRLHHRINAHMMTQSSALPSAPSLFLRRCPPPTNGSNSVAKGSALLPPPLPCSGSARTPRGSLRPANLTLPSA